MSLLSINISNPDWNLIEKLLPISEKMKLCPQDKNHHAEGDVWTHTKMCINSLINDPQWKVLNHNDQFITFFALLLHDIGKPLTTKNENGIITAKGHSMTGSIDARIFLWKHNIDFHIREQICSIIEYHQLPFFILNKDDFLFQTRKIAWTQNWNNLLLCAKHDMLGRICKDQQKHIDNINFLQLYLEQENLINSTYANDYTRLKYLNSPETISPEFPLYQSANQFLVIMMSGLPGSGKNSFIQEKFPHLESISFDEEREILNISPNKNGSTAIHNAYDKMKELLRKKQSFIFNATNLSKNIRQKPLNLFHNYGATTKIIYIEKNYEQLLIDDLERKDKSVGKKIIDQMLFKWQIPSILESHSVDIQQIKNFKKHILKK